MSIPFPDKVFFYCLPQKSPDKTGYPHLMIALGEGLKELGIKIYSNTNYWLTSTEKEEYLFNFEPDVRPEDCSIIILNHEWFGVGGKNFPKNLFRKNRNYATVFLDSYNINKSKISLILSSEFSRFDFIFKTHCGSKFSYPDNVYTWYFGLSERIINATADSPSFKERDKNLLVNFRHSRWMHSVRKLAHREFEPQIQSILPINRIIDNHSPKYLDPYHRLQWLQTAKRHYPQYYERLKKSLACSCFGGFFISSWTKNPTTNMTLAQKRIFTELNIKSKRILQWDSWRFWESLSAGCVTFHVDFDKYGIDLPVMPINWHHYIGVDLDNIQETIDRINDEPEILEKIGSEGKKWCLEHYSPRATALRFLKLVSAKFPN